jgi:type II secretory pathway pseudopilin PulG
MIVILIIAVLVAIAVPVFLSAQSNARRRCCQANLRTIDGAINTYNSQYDFYPPNSMPVGSLVPTLLKRNPTCPTLSSNYTLSAAGTPPTVGCPSGVGDHTI